jgi:phosphoribosylglycinamide formyltransferase 2
MRYTGLDAAISEPDTDLRLFGKPEVSGQRRLGVTLALAESIDEARAKANRPSASVEVEL